MNSISHYSGFSNTGYLTSSFLEGVMTFGEKLGPVFFQLSEKFSAQNKSKLFSYLKSLSPDLTFFLELRFKDWFPDNSIKQEWYDSLSSMKVGAVITDASDRRDIVHIQLTRHIAFIRFVVMEIILWISTGLGNGRKNSLTGSKRDLPNVIFFYPCT